MCVIVDEAYCEFNLLEDPDASLELLDAHPNLVLLRTFSKVHGLCGLRVGFALCGSEELPRALDQVRQPFFCNALAQAAADRGARATRTPSIERVTRTVAERISIDERLRALGLEPGRLAGELLLGRARRASATRQEMMRGLHERGVLVRGGARARQRRAGAARHLRAAGGERALPRRARRGARAAPPPAERSPLLDWRAAGLLQTSPDTTMHVGAHSHLCSTRLRLVPWSFAYRLAI